MAENKKIITTDLDFDNIKNNLKQYLQGQDTFKDYDFEGSGLNILLDILAYNTHYEGLHSNMAVNESFLDSASKRNSVVSIAKELGYTPSSVRASQATINFSIVNYTGPETLLELPKYTPFSTTIDKVTYRFYTTENYYANRVTTTNQGEAFFFNNIIIKEGKPLSNKFLVSDTARYIIPNTDVDLSTLRVTVQENSTSTAYEAFSASDSILNVDATSAVYFIKEIDNKLYELEFGNGVVGKALNPGNVINIEYMVCNKDMANGARTFSYEGPDFSGNASVNFVIAASQGSDIESIESIKWNAPRYYTAQNRCITIDDYKSVIYKYYPNAEAVNVWGGEQNVPPTYGDVYISVKPFGKDVLTQQEKDFLLNDVLQSRKAVTIHAKMVDAEFIKVQLDVSFYYDKNKTARSPSDLAALVRATIADYNQSNLTKFDGVLKYSNLSTDIDNTEPAIVSNIMTVKLHRTIEPAFNQAPDYVINLVNPIYNSGVPEESIISTGIFVQDNNKLCYIDDVPAEGSSIGKLRLFYYQDNIKTFVKYVGTVNYSSGLITINNLTITGTDTGTFKLIIKPQSNDVTSARNQIVMIDETLINIKPILNTAADRYTFTSSRN